MIGARLDGRTIDWAALENALRERASGGGLANVVQEFGQLRRQREPRRARDALRERAYFVGAGPAGLAGAVVTE